MTSNHPKKTFSLNVNTSAEERQYKGGSPAYSRFGARQTASLQPQSYLQQQPHHFYPIPHNQPNHSHSYQNTNQNAYPSTYQNAYQNACSSKPSSAKISLVPSEVSSIHHSHLTNNCSNKNKKSAKNGNPARHSAPNSLLVTPSTSSPGTPSESRRPSKPQGSIKKSESESFNPGVKYFRSQPGATTSTLPKAIPKAPAGAAKKPINLNNKAFKFEEYMPLCKVQNMLSKGQVVEVSGGFCLVDPSGFQKPSKVAI